MFKEALIVLAVVSSPISNVNQCTHGNIPSNFISSDTAPDSQSYSMRVFLGLGRNPAE